MPPREEDIQTALEMLPIHIIRKIIDERDIQFRSRRSDELIERLLNEDWTEDEFADLKSRLAAVEREKEPYSRYISNIDNIGSSLDDAPDAERVQELLATREVDFDDNNNLVEPGFEVLQASDDSVEAIHWTKSVNYSLTPFDDVKKEQTLYETTFNFDFSAENLLIDCNHPTKAKSLRTNLETLQIEASDINFDSLSNSQANSNVQQFVDDIKSVIDDQNPQSTLGDEDQLEVDLVNILIDNADLRDVAIGGRTDIMNNSEVERIREEHDSRIVRLEGQFQYARRWFSFKAGYTEGLGQVSVKKKGRVEEEPELVQEAFEFIAEPFNEYFVDV